MNVKREEKMAEAIERMKALRVFKPTIKQFKDDGYISISEQRQPCDFDADTGLCRHRRRPEGATHDVP